MDEGVTGRFIRPHIFNLRTSERESYCVTLDFDTGDVLMVQRDTIVWQSGDTEDKSIAYDVNAAKKIFRKKLGTSSLKPSSTTSKNSM